MQDNKNARLHTLGGCGPIFHVKWQLACEETKHLWARKGQNFITKMVCVGGVFIKNKQKFV